MTLKWKKRFIVNLWKWIVILMRAYHQIADIITGHIERNQTTFRSYLVIWLLIEELREDDVDWNDGFL